ncbi:MAG: flagellar motor switch protein FliG [Leptospiraceae bacterium]|nr:flagellar motor switch protein FliG [Leptospiraceae bacterium]
MSDSAYKIKLGGPKKAALLLMSLGKEEAAKVMAHLDDKLLEEVVIEMSKISSISKLERESILAEFKESLEESKQTSTGGIEAAREILKKSVGQQKAEEILRKVERKDISDEFEFLNEVEPQVLSSLLTGEAPQTIAVTLAYLHPKRAAEALKFFPKEEQSKIALKLATTSRTFPEAVLEIARILKKKYEARERSDLAFAGGAESLANILNHLDKNLEDSILESINEKSPEVASQVKDKLYAFEDILNLDNKEMRTLLSKLTNNEILTYALRGAGDEMKRHFFNGMSQNRAGDIIEEMETRGKVTLREINNARGEILKIARQLEEDGFILLKKKKDEFI